MDAMSPADAEVALRSLTRRFRAAVASVASDDETGDDLAHRSGPDGSSVLDHLTATVSGLSVFDRALERVLTSDGPVLHPGVLDPSRREFAVQVTGPPLGLDEALLDLDVTAGHLADRVADAPASDWTRPGSVAGGSQTVQAIDLVRQAVTESIERLRAVEQTLKAVRGT
jgi:hypothetical protein